MAMGLIEACFVLHRARKNLLHAQKELYLARTAPKPSWFWIRKKELVVLVRLTDLFNMQQCVKRLQHEAHNRNMHWRAFI